MELFISTVLAIFARYRTRRFLAKCEIIIDGKRQDRKTVLRAHEMAERQAILRQIYGVLSCGGRCVVEFEKNGKSAKVKGQ